MSVEEELLRIVQVGPHFRAAGEKRAKTLLSSFALPSSQELVSQRSDSSALSDKAQDMAERSRRLEQLSRLSTSVMGNDVQRAETAATGVERHHYHDHDHDGHHHHHHHHAAEPERAQGGSGHSRVPRKYQTLFEAVDSGQAVAFRDGKGGRHSVSLRRTRAAKGYRGFELQIGHDRLDVSVADGLNEKLALGRITEYFSRQPENLRGALDTIKVESGPNPKNDYWAKKYGIENFRSAAVGGGGTIRFFEGTRYLREDTFEHEFGHNVGSAVRKEQNRAARRAGKLSASRRADRQSGDSKSPNIPRGYSEASRADNRGVSDYGNQSIGEDFAEFYEAYRVALRGGDRSLRRFRKKFPNRYQFLEENVLNRHLDTGR